MTKSQSRRLLCIGLALTAVAGVCVGKLFAGGAFFANRAVGGVTVDAEGVLEAPTVVDQRDLDRARQEAEIAGPAAMDEYTELRALSLKQLEAAVAEHRQRGESLPPEIEYLAGLQRVRYVFVYPERNDVVIAGPAEGWTVDQLGNVVGRTTGRPVLKLDDLIVALRSGETSHSDPITCSIDPTQEGLQRVKAYFSGKRGIGNPNVTRQEIEAALGPQEITVTGVPADSHFARIMVAADFRMKRIAMHMDDAPIDGLPSFMQLSGSRSKSESPRWWLAPSYEPIARTADNLSWELRGQSVKCLTEDTLVDEAGNRQSAGHANPIAEKWAAMMTERYTELADHDSSFGELRNVMDLAVVGALIAKEQLLKVADLEIPRLMQEEVVAEYPVPRWTSTKASFVKKGRDYLVSASGGVEMLPWHVASELETVESIAEVRREVAADVKHWWWE